MELLFLILIFLAIVVLIILTALKRNEFVVAPEWRPDTPEPIADQPDQLPGPDNVELPIWSIDTQMVQVAAPNKAVPLGKKTILEPVEPDWLKGIKATWEAEARGPDTEEMPPVRPV